MTSLPRPLLIGWLLVTATLRADPEADVRDAVNALARSSYAWETTVRQRFSGETNDLRLNPRAPVEVRGRVDPEGCTEITLLPTRDLAAAVTAVFRGGDVVGLTPIGWLRRTEMRQTPGAERTVDFGGKPVRLSRAFAVALEVTAKRTPTEDLLDLLVDLKSYQDAGGLVIGELPDRAIERLWGDPQAKRAPEIQGKVLFKLGASALAEYHLVLAIGFPNSRTRKTTWSMLQWSTRFSGVGATTVDPPPAALQALDHESERP